MLWRASRVMVVASLVLVVGLMAGCAVKEPTAEEIVVACADALGGMDRIQAIRTLRVEVVYPDHGDEPRFSEIMRPNLVRSSATVFDGLRAAYWKPAEEEGGRAIPVLVPEAQVKDFELDVAWFFPAIFEYDASYRGVQQVEGADCHVLAVTLPRGVEMMYFIDAESHLISRVDVGLDLDGTTHSFSRSFSDYRPVDGVLFPCAFSYPGRHDDVQHATVTSIRVNVPFGEDHFELPAELG